MCTLYSLRANTYQRIPDVRYFDIIRNNYFHKFHRIYFVYLYFVAHSEYHSGGSNDVRVIR